MQLQLDGDIGSTWGGDGMGGLIALRWGLLVVFRYTV